MSLDDFWFDLKTSISDWTIRPTPYTRPKRNFVLGAGLVAILATASYTALTPKAQANNNVDQITPEPVPIEQPAPVKKSVQPTPTKQDFSDRIHEEDGLRYIIVKEGEILGRLAREAQNIYPEVTTQNIIKYTNIKNPNLISPGDTLYLDDRDLEDKVAENTSSENTNKDTGGWFSNLWNQFIGTNSTQPKGKSEYEIFTEKNKQNLEEGDFGFYSEQDIHRRVYELIFDAYEHWKGTAYHEKGHSSIPGKGVIGCGSLLERLLTDIGYNITPKNRMGTNTAAQMIHELTDSKTWEIIPKNEFEEYIKHHGPGAYIVGAPKHVAITTFDGDEIKVIHSTRTQGENNEGPGVRADNWSYFKGTIIGDRLYMGKLHTGKLMNQYKAEFDWFDKKKSRPVFNDIKKKSWANRKNRAVEHQKELKQKSSMRNFTSNHPRSENNISTFHQFNAINNTYLMK